MIPGFRDTTSRGECPVCSNEAVNGVEATAHMVAGQETVRPGDVLHWSCANAFRALQGKYWAQAYREDRGLT